LSSKIVKTNILKSLFSKNISFATLYITNWKGSCLLLYFVTSYLFLLFSAFIQQYIRMLPQPLFLNIIISAILIITMAFKSYTDYMLSKNFIVNEKQAFGGFVFAIHFVVNFLNIIFHCITTYVS
jgi:hypothetical protein